MPDLMTRLTALNSGPHVVVDDATIRADLSRAHRALTARRRRHTSIGAAATLGVVVTTALSYATFTNDGPHASNAVGRPTTVVTVAPNRPATSAPTPHTSTATSTTASASSTSRKPHTPAPIVELALMAYHGRQLPGYTVKRVPAGYVLQGISGSVLDVAPKGDHSPLNTFAGKLVVMLDDEPGSASGKPVSVNGHPGWLARDDDGIQVLTYNDGHHNIDVQAWNNIRISPEQLVRFAEGVTVLPDAQTGHG